MTTPLARGEKRDLGATGALSGGDVSVFGLNDARQLADDRSFVFDDQPQSPQGEVRSDTQPSGGRGRFNPSARLLISPLCEQPQPP